MTKAKTTRGINTPRCTETVDLEELLEWMVLNPVSHPDMRIVSEYQEHLTVLAKEEDQ